MLSEILMGIALVIIGGVLVGIVWFVRQAVGKEGIGDVKWYLLGVCAISITIAIFVGLKNLGNLIAADTTFWSPSLILVFCLGFFCGVGRLLMQAGKLDWKKELPWFAVWTMVGVLVYSAPHPRFWLVGVAIGLVVISVVFLPKYIKSKWAKVLAGFLTVSIFAFAMWKTGQIWNIKADVVLAFLNIVHAYIGNFWHILSTASAFVCSLLTYWMWRKKP